MKKREVLLSYLIIATIIFSVGWVSQYEIERDYNTGTFAPQGYAYTAVDQQSYTIASRGKAGFAGFYLSTYSDTGASTIFLPEDPADGTQLTIVDGDLNAGSNNIVLTPSGSNTIGETTSYTLANDGETVTAQFVESGDGNWHILAGSLSLASGATIAGAVTQDGGVVTINEAGADYDFRVESDNVTDALKVDAGTDTVTHGAWSAYEYVATTSQSYSLASAGKAGIVVQTVGAAGTFHLMTELLTNPGAGMVVTIKTGDTNDITIDTEGSETIDGAETYVLDGPYEAVTLTNNGTNWLVLSGYLE